MSWNDLKVYSYMEWNLKSLKQKRENPNFGKRAGEILCYCFNINFSKQ